MPSNVRREVITREFYPDTGGGAPMRKLAAQGNNGDTQLAHVNPWEAMLLKRLGGAGTVNPRTGLRQFYTFYNENDADQRAMINNYLSNPMLMAYNPSYVQDLSSGYTSGKYSYEDTMNAINILNQQAYTPQTATTTATTPTTTTSTDDGGGNLLGLESGYNVDFPMDIKQTSESTSQSQNYSGLPTNYQEQLLSALIPRLTSAVSNMESNIDKYTSNALSSYEQERQNAVRTGIPKAVAGLANRGIINSTQGNEILAKVLSDAATNASTKGYETAMQAALLKANMPSVLATIADLGKYTSGSMQSSSYSEDPTQMYQILAQLLAAQF